MTWNAIPVMDSSARKEGLFRVMVVSGRMMEQLLFAFEGATTCFAFRSRLGRRGPGAANTTEPSTGTSPLSNFTQFGRCIPRLCESRTTTVN